jgi:hypothetical protein
MTRAYGIIAALAATLLMIGAARDLHCHGNGLCHAHPHAIVGHVH